MMFYVTTPSTQLLHLFLSVTLLFIVKRHSGKTITAKIKIMKASSYYSRDVGRSKVLVLLNSRFCILVNNFYSQYGVVTLTFIQRTRLNF